MMHKYRHKIDSLDYIIEMMLNKSNSNCLFTLEQLETTFGDELDNAGIFIKKLFSSRFCIYISSNFNIGSLCTVINGFLCYIESD